ncbi:MAG: cardiolipin synthase [Clostridia bacterium]|nr:cardiolipin synthase [Clostridia bacterium]
MNKKNFAALLLHRTLIVLLLLLQLALIVYALLSGPAAEEIRTVLKICSLFCCLYILSRHDKGGYKLIWTFFLLLFPLFGGLVYLFSEWQYPVLKMRRRTKTVARKAEPLLKQAKPANESFCQHHPSLRPSVDYLSRTAGFPLYDGTRTTYFPLGETMWAELKQQLRKAEHYIFLEYFIVQPGQMWNEILEILREKAEAGVKVRLLYDDFGCFFLLPRHYDRLLRSYGIECAVFNPFRPLLSTVQNNRDHRKIAVIDGRVAFTGGINLADEYINAYEKHGHWKDTAVMLEGKAAWSFTMLFLQMWDLTTGTEEDCEIYYPWRGCPLPTFSDGYAAPYADTPHDGDNVGEHVYLQILHNAKHYVYINTPYLILDDSILSALCLAAKSGVDIRITTPHKADKWWVHMTTRSYYRQLLEAGVKIYEYTPGFLHAKSFVSDDAVAAIGSVNLDFRSLYLHFECGVWLYGGRAVAQLRDDYLQTLACCQPITAEDCRHRLPVRLLQACLRLVAPLM